MKRPVFYLAFSVLAGALAGRLVQAPPAAGWLLVCALLASVGVAAWRERRRRSGSPAGSAAIRLCLLALCAVAFVQQNALVRRQDFAVGQIERLSGRSGPLVLRGVVANEPSSVRRSGRVSAGGPKFVLVLRDVEVFEKTNREAARPLTALAGRVQVSITGEAAESLARDLPFQGEGFEVAGHLRLAPRAAHFDLFDYRAYLLSHGVAGTMSVCGVADARRRPEGDRAFESRFMRIVMTWRRCALGEIERGMPPNRPERAGAMRAMLVGETGWLDSDLRATFARMGGAHLFSVSGLHTSILALMIYALCRLLSVPPRASARIVLAFLAAYCVLVGFRPPVVRASVMAACMTIPVLARRAVDSFTALCLAVFATVLVNPAAPFLADFQLSYVCVFGLVTLGPVLREVLSIYRESGSYRLRRACALYSKWIAMPLSVSIAAQIAIIPLLSIYFRQVPLIGFVSNLVMVPLSAVVLGAGWALSLLGPLNPAFSGFLAAVASGATGVFIGLARWLAAPSWAAMHLERFPWWAIALYYGVLFSGPHMLMKRSPGAREIRRARFMLRLAALCALLAWWPLLARFPVAADAPAGGFRFTMLDVGQGDCLVLRFPDGKVLMVDTGPSRAARTILDYLRAEGIDEIAGLVLTHSDADHIGSAADVIGAVPVAQVFVGPSRGRSRAQGRLDEAIDKKHVPVNPVGRGSVLLGSEPVRLDVLSPEREISGRVSSNNQSVVFVAEYGEMTFLLTGDAEMPVEADLISRYGPARLRAEVLKVAHHGSDSSSSGLFVQAVRPQVALVSVGAGNSYGHPSRRVLRELEKAGAQVLRTDESGSIELTTDGRRLWIRATRREPEENQPRIDTRARFSQPIGLSCLSGGGAFARP